MNERPHPKAGPRVVVLLLAMAVGLAVILWVTGSASGPWVPG